MRIPRVKTWSCKAKSATGRTVSEMQISAPTKVLARLNLAHEQSKWLAWAITSPLVERITYSAMPGWLQDDSYGQIWFVNAGGQLHSAEPTTWSKANELRDWYRTNRPGCPVVLVH